MKVTIGDILLGDYTEGVTIGGLVGSATGDTVIGNGGCGSLKRLKDRGNYIANFNIPTQRLFETVSEAAKFVADTAKAGGASGRLIFEYDDGSDTTFNWAVARPTNLSHRGVNVIAVWQVTAGEKLL